MKRSLSLGSSVKVRHWLAFRPGQSEIAPHVARINLCCTGWRYSLVEMPTGPRRPEGSKGESALKESCVLKV